MTQLAPAHLFHVSVRCKDKTEQKAMPFRCDFINGSRFGTFDSQLVPQAKCGPKFQP